MTKNIKKIGKYALLGTIISANTTAPAQANSVFVNDDDLSEITYNRASSTDKNIFVETEAFDSTNSCISIPEFDLCEQFKDNKQTSSLNDSLLKKAQDSIDLIRSNETLQVKVSQNEVYYVPSINKSESYISQPIYSNTYTNVSRQTELTPKKKVPEPQALLGLIVFCLLAAKNKAAKNNHKSFNLITELLRNIKLTKH